MGEGGHKEDKMWNKFKKNLLSEDGMKTVNQLFLLLILIRNPIFAICVFSAWIAFLVYSLNHTKSKGMKGIYFMLAAFASVVIGLNIYALTAG